jgi:hypothetical protein
MTAAIGVSVRSWWIVLGVVLLALLGSAAVAHAQTPVYDESKVKAAFVVRFGQFVQWPQEAFQHSDGALVIAVTGSDSVYAGLVQLLAERGAQGRQVIVRSLKTPEDAVNSHILFIGSDARNRIEPLVASTARKPVLIVTDTADALEHGAMINFVVADRRVKFEIGLDNAEKAGLTVSSRLLSIAARVHRGGLASPQRVALEHMVFGYPGAPAR